MVEKTWKKKEFAPLVVKFEICCVSILYFFEVDSWVGLVTVFLGLPCNKEVELRIGSDFCFYCSSQAPIPESKISRTFGPRERYARIWAFVLHQVNSMSEPSSRSYAWCFIISVTELWSDKREFIVKCVKAQYKNSCLWRNRNRTLLPQVVIYLQ